MSAGRIVIVGAGHGGVQAAASLREEGYEGPIALICDDPHPPYQRPPLSKGFLLGETAEAQLMMRTAEAMEKKNILLKVGAGVTAIRRRSQRALKLAPDLELIAGDVVVRIGTAAAVTAGEELLLRGSGK